ncbi:MAG: hypothetical protein ABSD77_05975 [Verrucomicrobiota bacterium]
MASKTICRAELTLDGLVNLASKAWHLSVMLLLEIKNLKMDFGTGTNTLRAVDGVSLTIDARK